MHSGEIGRKGSNCEPVIKVLIRSLRAYTRIASMKLDKSGFNRHLDIEGENLVTTVSLQLAKARKVKDNWEGVSRCG